MAGITLTVFRLAVAWRTFSGTSSPLKATRATSASERTAEEIKRCFFWSCTGDVLATLTHRLSRPSLPSVCVWWGPAGTAGRLWGCSGSPPRGGRPGKTFHHVGQHSEKNQNYCLTVSSLSPSEWFGQIWRNSRKGKINNKNLLFFGVWNSKCSVTLDDDYWIYRKSSSQHESLSESGMLINRLRAIKNLTN